MKRILAALAVALCLSFTPAGIRAAHASDKFTAALTNSDGGTTYIATIAPNVSHTIQCTAPACYSTSASNQTAGNCTAHDYVLAPRAQGTWAATGAFLYIDGGSVAGSGGLVYGTTSDSTNQLGARQIFEREFDSTGDSIVLAKALDAGDPGCVVLQRTLNASSLR